MALYAASFFVGYGMSGSSVGTWSTSEVVNQVPRAAGRPQAVPTVCWKDEMSAAGFSEPFIRRPVGTTLLAIGLFLTGALAYRFLPVASMPTVDFPTINVTATRPGADPQTMAATVAAPLERRLGEIA